MNLLKSVFYFELKRRLRRRNVLIFFAILLTLLYFVNDAKDRYTKTVDNTEVFQKKEDLKISQYYLYTQYGTYGISILFIPSPFSTLNHDPNFEELLSNVNTVEKLEIYKPLKGRNFFSNKSDIMIFSGFILFIGIFFALLYGVDSVKNKPYLRFLSSLSTPGKLFWASSISRILLLIMAYFILLGFSLLWLLLHDVNLFQPQILSLITPAIILIISFFFFGCMIGSPKNKSTRLITFGLIYFLSIILIPGLADKYTQDDADEIEPLFPFELRNLELVMNVERRLYDQFGLSKSGKKASPELLTKIKEALDNEFERIFAREEKMMAHILEKIKHRHTVSCFFPVLFYNSVNTEVSSCGDLSFIDFYIYSEQIKKEFLNFYVKKKFLQESKPGQVESFVKKDENLFYAQSHLPYRFWFGILFNLIIYVGAAGIGAFFCFKRSLRPTPDKNSTEKADIKLKSGEDYHVDTDDYAAEDHIYNTTAGKTKGFKGQISIDNKNIVTSEKLDTVYICSPADIPPEVKVIDLLRLFKGLLKLSKEQINELKSGNCKDVLDRLFAGLSPDLQLKLLFKIGCLKDGKVYMLHDLINKCTNEYIKEFAEDIKILKAANAIILYFKDSTLAKPLKVDHHIVYTRVDGFYEWHEA
jgi:ABC-type multidrug transport system permease subunit